MIQSDFNTENIQKFTTVLKGIAKIHEAYNAYAEAYDAADAHVMDDDLTIWCGLYDTEKAKRAAFVGKIKDFYKALGVTPKNQWHHKPSTPFDWTRCFNDLFSEYGYQTMEWETKDLLRQVAKVLDYKMYLPTA